MNKLLIRFTVATALMLTAINVSAQNYSAFQGDILVLGTANTRSWSLQTETIDCKATMMLRKEKWKSARCLFLLK